MRRILILAMLLVSASASAQMTDLGKAQQEIQQLQERINAYQKLTSEANDRVASLFANNAILEKQLAGLRAQNEELKKKVASPPPPE